MIEDINLNIARKISKEFAIKNNIILTKDSYDCIEVIAAQSDYCIENLEQIFNKHIKVNKVSNKELSKLISKIYLDNVEDIQKIILEEAIDLNASDVHMEPRNNEVVIRLRVDGKLIVTRKLLLEEYRILLQTIKLNANMDITEKRVPQDGKLSFEYNNSNFDIRVSSLPVSKGEKVVLRILKQEGLIVNLDSLSFTREQSKKLRNMLAIKNGIVLVTGPTGSGKSTTLYSMLNTVKSSEINITTLEDPIEIEIDGINQVALNKKIDLDFASGLRSILRQDPDVIMVGEVRDSETAKISIRAALTGHKVFTTIHTKTPHEVFLRLMDMGVEDYLLRDSIIGIISQRLIRILCKKCKKKISHSVISDKPVELYESIGCEVCNYTGYKGRKLVASIVEINDYIKKHLLKQQYNIEELTNKEMKTNLLELLINGDIQLKDLNTFIIGEGIYEKII